MGGCFALPGATCDYQQIEHMQRDVQLFQPSGRGGFFQGKDRKLSLSGLPRRDGYGYPGGRHASLSTLGETPLDIWHVGGGEYMLATYSVPKVL